MAFARPSLPPGVQGEPLGELPLVLSTIAWAVRKPPAGPLCLRLRWWGADADTLVQLRGSSGGGAVFPLMAGPSGVVRYLRDAGTLTLCVEEAGSGRHIASLELDLTQLDVRRSLSSTLPLLGRSDQVLGSAHVAAVLSYSPSLSSFEAAELLAGRGEHTVALQPLPDASSAPSARPAAAAASVVPSAPAAAGRGLPATALMQQQQAQQVAPGRDLLPLALLPPPASLPQQQQVQQQPGPVRPDADLVLRDVVAKAEKLKAAMDAAAQRGISLALPAPTLRSPIRSSALHPAAELLPHVAAARPLVRTCFGVAESLSWHRGSTRTGSVDNNKDSRLMAMVAAAAAHASAQMPLRGDQDSMRYPGSQHLSHAADGGNGGYNEFGGGGAEPCSSSDSDSSAGSSRSVSCHSFSSMSDLDAADGLEQLLLSELLRARASQLGQADDRRSAAHRSSGRRRLTQQVDHQLYGAGLSSGARPGAALTLQPASPDASAVLDQAAQCGSRAGRKGRRSLATQQQALYPPSSRGPQLLVQLLGVPGVRAASGAAPRSLTAVLRCPGHTQGAQLDASPLLAAPPPPPPPACIALLDAPGCLSGPLLATDQPALAVELWAEAAPPQRQPLLQHRSQKQQHSQGDTPSPAPSGELLGITRVPLLSASTAVPGGSRVSWQESRAMGSRGSRRGKQDEDMQDSPELLHVALEDGPCLAVGTFPLRDPLRGTPNGVLQLRVVLCVGGTTSCVTGVVQGDHHQSPQQRWSRQQPGWWPPPSPLPSPSVLMGAPARSNTPAASHAGLTIFLESDDEGASTTQLAQLHLEAHPLPLLSQQQQQQCTHPPPCEVLGVRHIISVEVHGACGLPDAAALTAAGCAVPESRFLGYRFPGVSCCGLACCSWLPHTPPPEHFSVPFP